MTDPFLVAYVVMPWVIVAVGATGAWLHMRSLRRDDRREAELRAKRDT